MRKIGFIGVGIMGASMVRNLMKRGFSLSVYTRTKAKAAALLDEGARWCDSPAECAAGQDAVITMVGYPKDVEEVYFDGILDSAPRGCHLIDMTTSSPALAVRIFGAAAERGLFALDAPVSGGDVGARNGTLSIMVGGERSAFDACLPVFEAMGKTVTHMGPAGCGQHTKMANQIAIAGTIAGVCEAISYARASGLDPQVMLSAIASGAAGSWQLSNMGPRILGGDLAPGFYIRHFLKDMRIAAAQAESTELPLGVLHEVLRMYEKLEEEGLDHLGTQGLIRYYEEYL